MSTCAQALTARDAAASTSFAASAASFASATAVSRRIAYVRADVPNGET
jgi:hypothetical protein